MGVILDSSVLIAAERGRLDLQALLRAHPTEIFQIAAITAAELLHGCERANETVRERRVQFVESVIREFGAISFGLPEAREHARFWAALETWGTERRSTRYENCSHRLFAWLLGGDPQQRRIQENLRVASPGRRAFQGHIALAPPKKKPPPVSRVAAFLSSCVLNV